MRILPFLIYLLMLGACSSNEQVEGAINVPKNIVRYAQHLRITENKLSTKIEILSPETGQVEKEMNVSNQMVKTKHFIQVPLERLSVLSSTHVGMLAKLNAIESIVGITHQKYVYNKTLLEKIKRNEVLELGEEGQIPVEALLKSKCQAVIYSGFGKEFPHEKQLEGAGVHCIVNYDWREKHPLGKAEWILLFGYLTGKEKEAKAYFNRIVKEYNALKKQAEVATNQPTVLSGHLWGESWFAPAGKSFEAQFLRDANVQYQYEKSDGSGSLSLTMEKVLADNLDTEYWINPGFPTKEKLFGFAPRLKYLGPVLKNKIYDYSKSGNRYWEMSAIEPQKILSDYLHIFHPEEFPKENLYFYHQVK